MIIVSQDKTMILNFENIEAIGVGNPLENNEGKFKILCDTTSDTQYTMAEYENEERAKEVLREISKMYKKEIINGGTAIISSTKIVYEIPKE